MNFIYMTVVSAIFISVVFFCLYIANITFGKKILAFILFCFFAVSTQTAFAIGFGFFGGTETIIGYLILFSACSIFGFSFLILPVLSEKFFNKIGKKRLKSDPVYTSYDNQEIKNILDKAVRKTSGALIKKPMEKKVKTVNDGLAVDRATKLCDKLNKLPLTPTDKRALDLSRSVLQKTKTTNLKKDCISDAVFILIKLSAKYNLPLPKDKNKGDNIKTSEEVN